MLGHQRDWNEEGQKEGWTEKIKREETCQRKERVGISEVESTWIGQNQQWTETIETRVNISAMESRQDRKKDGQK